MGLITAGLQFTGARGAPIAFRSVIPESPRGAVLILHGIAEHSGRYLHVMERFAERGFACWAPDHRGHGETGGVMGDLGDRSLVIEDIRILTGRIRDEHPALPRFLLGHSMGGLLAVLSLIEFQEEFRGAILSGAALSLPEGLSPLLIAASGLIARILPLLPVQALPGVACRDPEVIARAEADPLVYHGKIRARTGYQLLCGLREAREGLPRISLPILILQGGDDSIVPPGAAELIAREVSSEDRTARILPGLYHEIMNEPEREEVIAMIGEWMEARL